MKFDQRPATLRAAAGATANCRWRGRGTVRAWCIRPSCRMAVFALLLSFSAAVATAQPPQLLFNSQQKEEALRAIPLDRLSDPVRAKVSNVVSRPTIYRHLPTQIVECDPDLQIFLLRYPEVVVNIWQLMGVTKVKVNRTGPLTFDAIDGAGTVCRAELVYGTPNVHVYYADGYYDGPLLQKPVTGDCVLLLRSSYGHRGGRTVVTNTLDVFARLDPLGVEILVKTFYPAVGKAVDFNFTESIKFVGQVSQAAEANGPGMQRVAANLQDVQPAVRESFSQHVNLAYQRAVLRKGDPSVPLASSASAHSLDLAADPGDEIDASAEAQADERNATVAVPGEQPAASELRRKPMFRR
jgi:hypothetical protein